MTPELKAKWIATLRNGECRQTTGTLRFDEKGEESFCCLGVLCEVVGVPRQGAGYSFKGFGYENIGLPKSILDHATQSKLVKLNDQEMKSFAEIADWIEENIS